MGLFRRLSREELARETGDGTAREKGDNKRGETSNEILKRKKCHKVDCLLGSSFIHSANLAELLCSVLGKCGTWPHGSHPPEFTSVQ